MDSSFCNWCVYVFFCFFLQPHPIYVVVQWRLGTRPPFQPSFCAMLHHITFVSITYLANHSVSCLSLFACLFLSHSPLCLPLSYQSSFVVDVSPPPTAVFSPPAPSSPSPFPCTFVVVVIVVVFHSRSLLPPLALSTSPVLLALFLLLCMKWVVCTTMYA
jgi:hypothetical protein